MFGLLSVLLVVLLGIQSLWQVVSCFSGDITLGLIVCDGKGPNPLVLDGKVLILLNPKWYFC